MIWHSSNQTRSSPPLLATPTCHMLDDHEKQSSKSIINIERRKREPNRTLTCLLHSTILCSGRTALSSRRGRVRSRLGLAGEFAFAATARSLALVSPRGIHGTPARIHCWHGRLRSHCISVRFQINFKASHVPPVSANGISGRPRKSSVVVWGDPCVVPRYSIGARKVRRSSRSFEGPTVCPADHNKCDEGGFHRLPLAERFRHQGRNLFHRRSISLADLTTPSELHSH